MKPLGRVKKTLRGFEKLTFKDRYGVECSLQQSSLADYQQPGTSAVWLGCEEANPRILIPGKSWQPLTIPDGALLDTRMHLDRPLVKRLIIHLQNWLDTGSIRMKRRVKI